MLVMKKQALHQKRLDSPRRKDGSSYNVRPQNDRACTKSHATDWRTEGVSFKSTVSRSNATVTVLALATGTLRLPSVSFPGRRKLRGLSFVQQHALEDTDSLKQSCPHSGEPKKASLHYGIGSLKTEAQRNLLAVSSQRVEKLSGALGRPLPPIGVYPQNSEAAGGPRTSDSLVSQSGRASKKRLHGSRHAYPVSFPANRSRELQRLWAEHCKGLPAFNTALLKSVSTQTRRSPKARCLDKSTTTSSWSKASQVALGTKEEAEGVGVSALVLRDLLLREHHVRKEGSKLSWGSLSQPGIPPPGRAGEPQPSSDPSWKSPFLSVSGYVCAATPPHSHHSDSGEEEEEGFVLSLPVPVLNPPMPGNHP
ncbi:hypothetical protein AOXY_G9642 [Acipenser oxyrinchus oxyrinchus]|uniref:Uncharacterized protein n=1 Tax=Acipenser oxyrinchus oxyrinchus TaxID=40147 RepID=A0AAD8DG88_ACIOX|nr:hypothetical protein AOXY_G9642 [Acipenser oxyrinchus oxyrinchus]